MEEAHSHTPKQDPHLCEEAAKKMCATISSIEVRDDDIFLIGRSRSGTTWTQEMTWLIANDMDFENAKECSYKRVPFLEHSVYLCGITIPQINMPERYEPNSIEFCKNLKSPRILKTHLSQEYLPKQLFNKQKKIIYIARNVKDVCLSGYHFQTNILNLPYESLESYAEVFMSDAFPKGDYWKNVLYFWNRRDKDNILFIRYEDMKKDLKGVIRKVAKFLGKSMTFKQEEDLVKWLSFESFQKNTAVNQASFYNTDGFIREGKVGGHKNEMTPALISKIDRWSADYLKCSDYEYEL